MSYKNMGDLISELRKQQNMTQKDLADKLNVTDKAVSKWERGITCPDIATIPTLASVLNISSEELINFKKSTFANLEDENTLNQTQKINRLVNLVLKSVGMAMGIAVLVLSLMNSLEITSAVTMLAIGLTCIGIVQIKNYF